MTRAQVREPLQEPSLARARVWAPLSLLLVLACGAWFFRGTAWQAPQEEPGTEAPPVGLMQPGPEAPEAVTGALPARGDQGGEPAPLAAAQVIEVVAQRGRQASAGNASAPLSAESLQARVRRDPGAVHRQTAGQRLRLQGTLASVEAGEPGVVLLHLALEGEPATVRVVASPALAQVAPGWAAPKALSLDCLSQGVMMGEWLLVDCRE